MSRPESANVRVIVELEQQERAQFARTFNQGQPIREMTWSASELSMRCNCPPNRKNYGCTDHVMRTQEQADEAARQHILWVWYEHRGSGEPFKTLLARQSDRRRAHGLPLTHEQADWLHIPTRLEEN